MGLAWPREVPPWTIVPGSMAAALILAPIAIATPASADGAGAFVGGMMAGRAMNNMNRRTPAEYKAKKQAILDGL